MVFDGEALWVIYDSSTGNGLRRIKISEGTIVNISKPFNCDAERPEDIAFDGTHIWICGNEGVTKIEIDGGKDIDKAFKRRDLTALAFNGDRLLAAEPNQGRVNRINIFAPESDAGGQEITGDPKNYEISRMCFDGHYTWVAAYRVQKNNINGIVHRLLL
jgi:hypothetical protein